MPNETKPVKSAEEWADRWSCALRGDTLGVLQKMALLRADFAQAIAEAEARGRVEGLEEAAKVAQHHGDICFDCGTIAAHAIRALASTDGETTMATAQGGEGVTEVRDLHTGELLQTIPDTPTSEGK